MRKPTIWVPTRSDTNRAVQSQKMVRGWKFWFKKVEELYYQYSENKGADQLRSYCEADLRLCFHLCRLLVMPCDGSNYFLRYILLRKALIRLYNAKTSFSVADRIVSILTDQSLSQSHTLRFLLNVIGSYKAILFCDTALVILIMCQTALSNKT